MYQSCKYREYISVRAAGLLQRVMTVLHPIVLMLHLLFFLLHFCLGRFECSIRSLGICKKMALTRSISEQGHSYFLSFLPDRDCRPDVGDLVDCDFDDCDRETVDRDDCGLAVGDLEAGACDLASDDLEAADFEAALFGAAALEPAMTPGRGLTLDFPTLGPADGFFL